MEYALHIVCHSMYTYTMKINGSRRIKMSKMSGKIFCSVASLVFVAVYARPALAGGLKTEIARKHAEVSIVTGEKPQFTKSDCLACHGVRTEGIPYINETHFESSVHKDLTCTDCHSTIKALPHPEKLAGPNCGACHGDVESRYKGSVHGKASTDGISKAPRCWDCHGKHDILPASDPSSTVYPQRLPSTCGKCHNSALMSKQYNIPVSNPYELYEKSVHAFALKNGLPAATCSDCHNAHDIQPMNVTTSTIAKANVPKTCSKCHPEQYDKYTPSVHWTAYLHGISSAPVCTDCHAEHAILSPTNPNSPVYPLNVPKTCTNCHGNVQIAENFGMPAIRLSEYMKSFHGVMIKGGSIVAANCASCHRAHEILPESDPRSSVYPQNLPEVCGKCHAHITKADIRHLKEIHGPMGISKEIMGIVRMIYIWLIAVTIGGMLLYVYADFIKKLRSKEREELLKSLEGGDYIRFNATERALHIIHLFSFFILAYTGFAHHWPDGWWSWWLTHIDNGLVRAWIHRVSGVVLIVSFIVQFVLMFVTERGREQFRALLPVVSDVTGTVQLFLYNIDLAGKRPRFGRFTPFEKFEYWALIWGNTLMALTGLALWFTTATIALLPVWFLNLFMMVHFYEAILATLAILIWHLYWTVFDPIMYPYNPSIFSGKMPMKLMEEEHPLEIAEKKAKTDIGLTSTEKDQYKP